MRKGSHWLSEKRKKQSGLYLLAGLIGIGLLIAGSVTWAQQSSDGSIRPSTLGLGGTIGTRSPVPVDGKWQEFLFGATGTFATGCSAATCIPSSAGNADFAGSPPWTFTAGSSGVDLTVTDAFDIGDGFEVFDNNVSLGVTSTPGTSGNCGSDPEPCSTNPSVSHRTYSLGAGNHSITIKVAFSNTGAAYFIAKSKPAGPCGATYAASIVPDGVNILNILYRFRDEVMLQSDVGRQYVDLYYKHTAETTQALMRDWSLTFRVATLLWRHQSTFMAVINHQPVTISAYDANEIDAIIGAFMQGASPALSADLAALRQSVRNRTVFADFGVRLH